MAPPLIAALLLDAQSELVRAADGIPDEYRHEPSRGLHAPGWIVAHAAFFTDAWLSADARGRTLEDCEPWLRAWFERQRVAGVTPIDTPFAESRAALDRVLERITPWIEALTDDQLIRVHERVEENGWPSGTTVGYLVARAVGHLFAHASELNVIVTAAGARDMGLPGGLAHTVRRSARAGDTD